MAEGSLAVLPQQRIGSTSDGMQLASARHKEEAWDATLAYAMLAVSAVGHQEGKANGGVVVYISKGSAKALKAVPKEIDGVPIVIRKVGLISINPAQAGKYSGEPKIYTRGDRIACGSSCATTIGDAGTLGAIVTKKGDDALFALSNNHVLAGCNQIPPGLAIMSPAPADSRPGGRPPLAIGELTEAIPMHSGNPKHVKPCEEDVAIGRITEPTKVCTWQGGDDGYDTPVEITEPEMDMRVKKVGRTTGLTLGAVDAQVTDPYPVACNVKGFKANVWFNNFWSLLGDETPFALPGDSGSLVVTEDGKKAVGLLFSSSPNGAVGYMVTLSQVVKKLGIDLKSGYGI